MRYFISLLIVVLYSSLASSQTYEIGGMIGGSNYIGDIGNTTFINPTKPMVGILLKWNRSTRHAFRFSYIHGRMGTSDADAKDDRRNERNYKLIASVDEVNLGLEYNFWDFDMYEGKSAATPYLSTGLTYFIYRGTLSKPEPRKNLSFGTQGSLAIPIILGYKTSVFTNFVLAAEVGARYTFTDNLDGSANEQEGPKGNSFGNVNNNDWYMFTGITLTYSFGRKPCYCIF